MLKVSWFSHQNVNIHYILYTKYNAQYYAKYNIKCNSYTLTYTFFSTEKPRVFSLKPSNITQVVKWKANFVKWWCKLGWKKPTPRPRKKKKHAQAHAQGSWNLTRFSRTSWTFAGGFFQNIRSHFTSSKVFFSEVAWNKLTKKWRSEVVANTHDDMHCFSWRWVMFHMYLLAVSVHVVELSWCKHTNTLCKYWYIKYAVFGRADWFKGTEENIRLFLANASRRTIQ